MDTRRLRRAGLLLLAGSLALAVAGRAAAHGGSLRSEPGRSLAVPLWLFLSTGGGIVGVSFLLTSFVTDRGFIRWVHSRRRALPVTGTLETGLRAGGRLLGIAGLLAVLAVGAFGPRDPLRNLGVLVVWVGWWAGYTVTTYLVGDAWPALNPWRVALRLRDRLPAPAVDYPDRLGAWPGVAGLLGLVYLEVVSPLADDPRLLTVVVAAYTVVTLAGAYAVGEAWFRRVDPVSRVFRYYGQVAPLVRERDDENAGGTEADASGAGGGVSGEEGRGRIRARIPGTGLDDASRVTDRSEVAFVVALLWVTTYDGLVATAPWARFARTVVGLGVPPVLLYAGTMLVGFAAFLGAYRLAVRRGRRAAESYRSPEELARRFAPPLLAIAAGYHLAHYLGYFVELSPALVGALTAPLSPPAPTGVVLPTWTGALELGFVLLGHLVAIWAAHAVAHELFASRLQAVRSQFALTAVMVGYTMASLWIVSRPYAAPPFV